MENNENTADTGENEDTGKVRAEAIVGALRAATSPVLNANAEVAAASDVLQDLSSKRTSLRMTTLVDTAAASQMGQWSLAEIEAGLGEVLRTHNDTTTRKTLETFLGEVKAAAHPRSRAHVTHLRDACMQAWAAEDVPENTDKPCRKAFPRLYQMTVRAFRLAADTGTVMEGVDGVIAWARACDPDLNINKVLSRLKSIQASLAAFSQDWPVPAFTAIDEYLDKVTKGELARARKGKLDAEMAAENERLGKVPLAPLPAAVKARAAPTVVAPVVAPVVNAAATLAEALGEQPPVGDVPAGTDDALAELFAEAA